MSVEATLATWRLSKKQVTPTEKLFLLSCANRAGESHECWPSIKRLCSDTGYDRKTIMKTRQSVIEKGLLIYSGEFKGRSGQIPVMQLTYVDNSLSEFTSTENGTSTRSGTGDQYQKWDGYQYQKWDTESKRGNLKDQKDLLCENEKISSSFAPYEYQDSYYLTHDLQQPSFSQRFEEFWALYPNKKNKRRACSMWENSNLDEKADLVIDKLKLQIAKDRHFLEGYAPNPSNYINDERWEDEIIEPQKPTNTKSNSSDALTRVINKHLNKGNVYEHSTGNTIDLFRG